MYIQVHSLYGRAVLHLGHNNDFLYIPAVQQQSLSICSLIISSVTHIIIIIITIMCLQNSGAALSSVYLCVCVCLFALH